MEANPTPNFASTSCDKPTLMRAFLHSCFRKNNNSVLAARFEQILEEKISKTPKSLIDQDPTLQHLDGKYHHDPKQTDTFEHIQHQNNVREKTFERQFQKEVAYVKSEHLLRSKEDREIAGTHWSGTERIQDTALRMLLDSAPKAKKIARNKSIITPPKGFRARVADAKEDSLNYKIGKTMTPEDKEKEEFKELYKERLLGPTMFVDHTSSNTAMGIIGNMASARINAVIDRKTGKFESPNMDKVRGKPLDKERLANSTDSNYFMNQILKSQECLPVWIENQQGIDREISAFRFELQRKMTRALIEYSSVKAGSTEKQMTAFIGATDLNVLSKSMIKLLVAKDARYIRAKIEDLNRGVRNYNLQCPSTGLHKWKLTMQKELEKLAERVLINGESHIKDHFVQKESNRKLASSSGNSFLGLFSASHLGSNAGNSANTESGLGFWNLMKRIFRA